MNRALVLEAGPTHLRVGQVELSGPLKLLRTADLPGLDALDADWLTGIELIIHRLIHAPEGCQEAVTDLDPCAVAEAGLLEAADTARRLDLWATAHDRWPALKQAAVFDTAWFAALPELARHFALAPELAARHRLRRTGRHGPVHRRAAERAEASRVVSVYLGEEASVAAILDGRPIDCSAAATALAGLPGGTTVGDVDPAAILFLVEEVGLNVDDVERLLRCEAGLAGLTGRASAVACRTDRGAAATLGLAFLAHRVRRLVGAAAALLGGLDALVLTCAPEFDEPRLLEEIAGGLRHLGVGGRVPVLQVAGSLAVACAAAALPSLK